MNIPIRFLGRDLLLIGDRNTGGAISTQEQYENFEISFAHLMADGRIMRFGEEIGTRDDITFLGDDGKEILEAGAVS